ncbi:GATA transcription factor 12 [Euphorbia peplus]|nr:GATA transcription factor 12 [Euphorbia peplus]
MEAPEFYNNQSSSDKPSTDHFIVEDLLDFSNDDDDDVINDVAFDSVTIDSSTVTPLDSCNSSNSFSGSEPTSFNANFSDVQFSSDLCVPYEDLAELEWLSNFVEESFSSDDLQNLHLISGIKARTDDSLETRDSCNNKNNNNNNPIFHPEMSVPAKARSKRSRTATCNWASRLLLLSPSTTSSSSSEPVPQPHHPNTFKKTVKVAGPKRRESSEGRSGNGEGRKCLHCATDKTPQWRTGPMGPKTLCNACGVRYKSGRLVPEYRPAASPTFMLTKHSNSHRKVMELRRQKEVVRAHEHHPQQFIHHHHHQNMVFDVTNSDDYLIHQHVGPDFRQLIQ